MLSCTSAPADGALLPTPLAAKGKSELRSPWVDRPCVAAYPSLCTQRQVRTPEKRRSRRPRLPGAEGFALSLRALPERGASGAPSPKPLPEHPAAAPHTGGCCEPPRPPPPFTQPAGRSDAWGHLVSQVQRVSFRFHANAFTRGYVRSRLHKGRSKPATWTYVRSDN